MRGDELLDILEHIDPDLIENADRKPKNRWLRWTAIAACFALLMGLAALPRPTNQTGPTVIATTPTDEPAVPSTPELPANQLPLANYADEPEKLTGIHLLGNPAYSAGLPQNSPPAFEFNINMVVEARVIEILPDIYTDLQTNGQYHLLRMQTLEAINVKDMPDEFLLRLYSYMSPELDKFDSLILSLEQVGIENYLMISETSRTVEPFANLFQVYNHYGPHYGSVVAFSGGLIDISLWDLRNWGVSTEYLNHMLDGNYIATKDSTPQEVKERLRSTIYDPTNLTMGTEYLNDRFFKDNPAADLVTPFQNGVFAHTIHCDAELSHWCFYTRYINGFPTSEKITVNGKGDITYEGEAFTQEELSHMPDLSALLERLDLDALAPPNTTVQEDFKLHNCGAQGQYVKVDGTVYGVVKVSWYYLQPVENYSVGYYDALFYLVQADGTYQQATRAELEETLGQDLFASDPEYGIGIELPLE